MTLEASNFIVESFVGAFIATTGFEPACGFWTGIHFHYNARDYFSYMNIIIHVHKYIDTEIQHASMHACIHPSIHPSIHTYIHTYLLLLISMLWHRQAIFKSKGDKLCPSAECRIWTRGPRHQIASRLNAHWQTDWAIEDQAKNLNSTASPYDQRAFSPLDPTVSWLSHLALAIYIFVVVNFDALAQASDIQIERRQVVFLCWMQDLNPGSQTLNRQQTECSLTNRLSYRGSS